MNLAGSIQQGGLPTAAGSAAPSLLEVCILLLPGLLSYIDLIAYILVSCYRLERLLPLRECKCLSL